MTQDEIVMCADASGISLYGMGKNREKFIHYLKAFAKLVAQHEREECLKLADSLGWVNVDHIQARGQA